MTIICKSNCTIVRSTICCF